jgi:hypothetical protein
MASAVEVVVDIATGFGIFYFWGQRSGGGDNPPTVSAPAGTDSSDCTQACARWDNARQMLCGAKADETAARSRADGIRGQLATAIAAEATATGIAVTATIAASVAVLPWVVIVLAVIAAILWATVLVLMGVVAFLGGELNSAEADVANKASARQAWDTEVATARAEVNSKCSQAEANACLSRTAPC